MSSSKTEHKLKKTIASKKYLTNNNKHMKCNRFKTGFFLGTLTFLFALNVNAQSSEKEEQDKKRPTIEEMFNKMDENEDGKLSEKEAKGPLKRNFAEIDTDEDGFITKEEMEKAPKPKGRKSEKENQ